MKIIRVELLELEAPTASVGDYGRGVEIFLRNLDCYLRGHSLANEVTASD
jgi:hypothetical protein